MLGTFATALLAGCDGTSFERSVRGEALQHPNLVYYKNQTAADQCLNRKLEELGRIDHETPVGPAVDALVRFCEAQYPAASAGVAP